MTDGEKERASTDFFDFLPITEGERLHRNNNQKGLVW